MRWIFEKGPQGNRRKGIFEMTPLDKYGCREEYIVLEVTEEKSLRSFGHLKRMPGNRLQLRTLEWEPEGIRRMGRPKEKWMNGVRWNIY
jgi:hypothetical protein